MGREANPLRTLELRSARLVCVVRLNKSASFWRSAELVICRTGEAEGMPAESSSQSRGTLSLSCSPGHAQSIPSATAL